MKKRLVLITALVLIVATLAAPAAQAATIEKYLKAAYGVQIVFNGTTLSSTNQPFIVNGVTYVPLRMLMDSFGDKQISWDGPNNKVIIASSTSPMESVYMQQITSRNAQIATLQAQVKALEAKLAAAGDVDLDDLEDELNDTYEDDDVTITLSGDEEEVTLKIAIDEEDWDALSDSEKEDLLQDICDDIWEEADEADISGTVKDGTKELDSFDVEADDDVSLDGDVDLDSLEDSINDDYEDYRTLDFSFTLSGDEDDVTINVDIDADDWDDLSTSYKVSLLNNISDDIWDEVEDADLSYRIKDSGTAIETIDVDNGDDVASGDFE